MTLLLADLKAWGRYTAPGIFEAGGTQGVAKRLLGARMLTILRDGEVLERSTTWPGARSDGLAHVVGAGRLTIMAAEEFQ